MADTFGISRLRNATVVLPTPDFFPDTFLNRPEDVAPMFERLCEYMGVASGRVELEIVSGPILCDGEPVVLPDGRRAGGIYRAADSGEKERIEIVEWFLQHPTFLAAALIHELSHAVLLGEGHLTGEEPDHEDTTDLYCVFAGMGVFLANTVIHEHIEQMGHWSRHTLSHAGYLFGRQLGYGLALFAWLRDETCPRWARHLKGEGREALRLGLRYITKTRDARFHPDFDGRTRSRSPSDMIEELQAHGAATRYSALKDLSDSSELPNAAVPTVTRSLRDSHAEVRALAAEVLGAQRPLPESAIDDLRELLVDDEGPVRIAAAKALADVPDLPDGVLHDFLSLVDPERPASAIVLAAMIQRFGRRAERFAPRVLDCLARALAQCNDTNTAVFCECLWAICEEPLAAAERHFGESRLELLADVRVAIRNSVPSKHSESVGETSGPETPRPWPRLSETLPFVRHPHVCQSCGQTGEERWMEHDEKDRPEPIFVVLCKGCSDVVIEPHPRVYRKMPSRGT